MNHTFGMQAWTGQQCSDISQKSEMSVDWLKCFKSALSVPSHFWLLLDECHVSRWISKVEVPLLSVVLLTVIKSMQPKWMGQAPCKCEGIDLTEFWIAVDWVKSAQYRMLRRQQRACVCRLEYIIYTFSLPLPHCIGATWHALFRIEYYTLVLTLAKHAIQSRFYGNLSLIHYCCSHFDKSIVMDTSALNGKGMRM